MKIHIFLFLSVALLATGCKFKGEYFDEVSERERAEKVVDEFYGSVQNREYSNVNSLFSKQFFQVTSKNDLEKFLLSIFDNAGSFKFKELAEWKTRRVVGAEDLTEYLLIYKVSYERSATIETFRLVTEGDDIKIIGYNVNPDRTNQGQ